jgi:Tol biopolymer transport system component
MPLTIGSQLGSHEITALLGKGGMGEVYRARDLRLKREVAIKILPEEFSRDADRVSRFQREAEVLASLNHPNIASIYDVQEAQGSRFLVLELVEGDTLAERVARGPLAPAEALTVARQIAEALEAAHEKGIVHRDLKPANVKITPEGRVKVLDFGLAKVRETAQSAALSDSPTLTSASTPGTILGTAAYMSPEQATGKETDRTTDVWAFGCVLYEMITGRRLFDGENVVEILGGIIKTEPDWNHLPPETSEGVRRLLRRCLRKDRAKRLHDVADARIEIEEALARPTEDHRDATPTQKAFRLGWIAILAGFVIAVGAGLYLRRPTAEEPEQRFEISIPSATSFAVSPDGRKLLYEATAMVNCRLPSCAGRIWVRPFDSITARPVAGTEGAIGDPFWSPDGQSIGFFVGGALRRVDVNGGSVQTLTTAMSIASGTTGTWGRNGVIVFSPNVNTPLYSVSERGGHVTPVTHLDPPRQLRHAAPTFLPDGNHFLFFVAGNNEGRGIYIGSLDLQQPRKLLDAEDASFMAPDRLIFLRQGTLFSDRFDTKRLEAAGTPEPIAEHVGGFSASAGLIAYSTDTSSTGSPRQQFTWFDRSGKSLGSVGEPFDNFAPELSPDDKWLATHAWSSDNFDVYLVDLVRGRRLRFTSDQATEGFPIWSPDSKRVVFLRDKDGFKLLVKPADGSAAEELVGVNGIPVDWSPDGRFILFTSSGRLYAAPVTEQGKATGEPFAVTNTNTNTAFREGLGKFSPDGHWIAYQSNQSGRDEIYVQPFPGPGATTLVSASGGRYLRWPRKSKELFYLGADGTLFAVRMTLPADGKHAEAGAAVAIGGGLRLDGWNNRPSYNVSADGQRIIAATVASVEPTPQPPITIILHWKPPSSTGK